MPNPDRKRLSARELKQVRDRIIARDGPVCWMWERRVDGNTSHPGRLEIHHVDYDSSNWDESNLRLLCSDCHKVFAVKRGESRRGMRTRERLGVGCDLNHKKGYKREREREVVNVPVTKRNEQKREEIWREKKSVSSLEMEKSEYIRETFVPWLKKLCVERGEVSLAWVRDNGAYLCSCMPVTIDKHLRVICCEMGEFTVMLNGAGIKVIRLKSDDMMYGDGNENDLINAMVADDEKELNVG